jgi:FKBP-type peptidyl-prolyl cis-trans isomerase
MLKMKVFKVLFAAVLVVSLASCNNQGVTKKSLDSDIDSVSYALGLDMGMKVKTNFAEIEKDLFVQGFKNGLDSTDIKLDPKTINQVLNTFFQKRQQEEQLKARKAAEEKAEADFAEVKKEGEKFLEENKTKENVQVTESGLQYIVLKEGSGDKPVANSRVEVHYHGTLIDGTVFDSSVDKGTPSKFFVNQVIKGWTEGLQLMNEGSKYKFFVPQELAYGAFPHQGGKVRPFDMLIFEVELIDIIK